MSDQRSIDHSPWLWISKAAVARARNAAGPNGLAIYVALAHLESDAKEKDKSNFWASAENLADLSGLSRRTIFRVLPVLQNAKLIAVQSGAKTRSDTCYQSNQYRILNVGPASATTALRSANESGQVGTHKRTFSRREKEGSSESKESGAAGASAADAASADAPHKTPSWLRGF